MSNDELACTYAALILHDGGVAVNAASIQKVCKEAGINVTAFWPNFFEKVLKTENLDNLILNAGAPAASAAPAVATTTAPVDTGKKPEPTKEAPKKPAKKETSSEPDDGGFDLFG